MADETPGSPNLAPPLPPESVAHAVQEYRAQVMGYHVLVVDDYSDGADSLAMFLQMSGFEVQVVYPGQSAVSMAVADPPDAVLCDINMPGLDGFGVAREIRAALPHPPLLIAVTARREHELLG